MASYEEIIHDVMGIDFQSYGVSYTYVDADTQAWVLNPGNRTLTSQNADDAMTEASGIISSEYALKPLGYWTYLGPASGYRIIAV